MSGGAGSGNLVEWLLLAGGYQQRSTKNEGVARSLVFVFRNCIEMKLLYVRLSFTTTSMKGNTL